MSKERLALVMVIGTLSVIAISGLAAAGEGVLMPCNSTGYKTYVFSPGETVYVRGWGLAEDDNVSLYVVNATVWTYKDGDLITDIVKGPILSNSREVENIKALGTVAAGDIPYPGEYDIVYDADQNGYYNKSTDLVHYELCVGFRTIPEFTTVAIPVAIALLGAFFFMRRRRK